MHLGGSGSRPSSRSCVLTLVIEPVLRIVPIRKRLSAAAVFGNLRGRVVYHEDPLAPTTDEWSES